MRRRRGGGAAPAEACGVWLDTAELKRGRARPLTLRAPSRAAGRKQSLVLLPQPGSRESSVPRQSSISRQSSILSFFSPQPDERDKENRRPAPWEDCRVKILPLPQLEGAQEEPPGAGQGLQGTARARPTPLEPRVGSGRLSRASPGAGGDSWGRDRDKPWVSPAGTGSGGRRAVPCSRAGAGHTNPAPGAAPSGVCCSPRSPGPAQPLRERGQVWAGPCRDSQDCQGRDRDRDTAHWDRDRDTAHRDWDSPDRDRDSPDRATAHRDRDSPDRDRDTAHWDRDTAHRDRDRDTAHRDRDTAHRDRDRDTAHRDWDSPDRDRDTAHWDRDIPSPARVTPSPYRDRDSPDRDRDSPDRTTADRDSPDRDRNSPDRDRDTAHRDRATPSPPRAPQPPELGSEPLFTQDSEGNRVIKHW